MVRLPYILHQVLTKLGLGNRNHFSSLIRWKMAFERCGCACSTAKLETCCWPFTAGFMASWLTYQHHAAARGYLVAMSREQNMRHQRWVGEVTAALELASFNLQGGHAAVGLAGCFTLCSSARAQQQLWELPVPRMALQNSVMAAEHERDIALQISPRQADGSTATSLHCATFTLGELRCHCPTVQHYRQRGAW